MMRKQVSKEVDLVLPHHVREGVDAGAWHGRPKRVDLLLWGESPGPEEATQGVAFVGPTWRHVVEPWLKEEFPDLVVLLDNVCPEVTWPGKPDAKLLKKYADYRRARIAQVRPKVQVLFGEIAMKAFGILGKPVVQCGRVKLLKNLRGCEGAAAPWAGVCSVHPAYCLRNKKQIHLLRQVARSVRACMDKSPEVQRLEKLPDPKLLTGFDIETDALRPVDGQILMLGFSGEKTGWIPSAKTRSLAQQQKALAGWWSGGPRVVHNARFELAWMRSLGAKDPEIMFDTYLMATMLNENQPRGLDHLVVQELQQPPYWHGIPSSAEEMAEVPVEELGTYCARDAKASLDLYRKQWPLLSSQEQKVYRKLLSPLVKLLVTMETRGCRLDMTRLKAQIGGCEARLEKLERQVKKVFPGLNVRSPKQMEELLFEKLGLEPVRVGKSGTRSTDGETLQLLSVDEPKLIPLSELKQVKHEYDFLCALATLQRKGFIHTNLNLGAVVTWRLSSSQPNLQNIRREGSERELFVSRFKGGVIVQADYKQHELRVHAAFTRDPVFLEDFSRPDGDPHQTTADRIQALGVPCDRPRGKNVNFSVIFDITNEGLWTKYWIPKEEGKKLLKAWHKLHPWTETFREWLRECITERGYVENLFGLRRHLDEVKGRMVRQGYNTPVQGSAVCLNYWAMLKVEAELRRRGLKALLILQIHDSIVVDSPKHEVGEVQQILLEMLKSDDYLTLTAPWFREKSEEIPLDADVKIKEHL